MTEGLIKRMLPRSLYGRAALILLVPILTIQFVVSVVFIQRHFEGVTRQMTTNLITELSVLLDQIDNAETLDIVRSEVVPFADTLGIGVDLPPTIEITDQRLFYDLSGRVGSDMMEERLPSVVALDLASNTSVVRMLVDTGKGAAALTFSRKRISASNPHQLLVLMVFTGVLMTVIAFLFLRNQLRPIRRLAFAADAFGKGKLVEYRPAGATEVRLAGNAFLDMRARIERQIEQRTMMLSGVSHDLRTPLTRLKLALSLAEDGEDTEAMRRDIEEMERILDTFLEFARGSMGEDPQQIEISQLAERVVERSRRSGGEVALIEGETDATVTVRVTAVERALQNLVGNALRYGDHAEVSFNIGNKAVDFVVEDDGPGIAEDQRETAMKAFSRLDRARNQDRGTGVGLGLAIAADVARIHGGTLRLSKSERLGGLKAELVLPR